jgi:anti-sigma B factor antagonist
VSEKLKIEALDDKKIIRLVGRVDARYVQEISTDVKAVATDILALDMSKVTFIDSSALGLIVSTFRRNQEAGSKFCLFGMSPQVRAVFELTRLHRIFDIFHDEQQALAAL